jgi:hypothetical protein
MMTTILRKREVLLKKSFIGLKMAKIVEEKENEEIQKLTMKLL